MKLNELYFIYNIANYVKKNKNKKIQVYKIVFVSALFEGKLIRFA